MVGWGSKGETECGGRSMEEKAPKAMHEGIHGQSMSGNAAQDAVQFRQDAACVGGEGHGTARPRSLPRRCARLQDVAPSCTAHS